jgi:hypothetical protein
MKYSKTLLTIATITTLFLASSCDKYLNEMPDNRAEINTYEKVRKLLVSAYPSNDYILLTEMSSDNIDDYTESNPNSDRFIEQAAYWKDVTESDNEAPDQIWSACYSAIGSANMALQTIEEMGNPKELQASKGEALICRAYNHFMLVNIFAKHYNKATSATDLGVVYMEAVEKTLFPKYKRETVAEVYAKIEKDLEAGLPLVSDIGYNVPKYHFTKKATYAFASRFNLYYEKWDKVVAYSNEVLTNIPQVMLRDNRAFSQLAHTQKVYTQAYVSENNNCNLLLVTAYSSLGVVFGGWEDYSRFSHGMLISTTETIQANGPWGPYSASPSTYWSAPFTYSGTNLDKDVFGKLPYLFEIKDPVARTGFAHTAYAAFTADEVLLNRAEAYVMLKKYDEATTDLALWKANFVNQGAPITRDLINTFYGGLAYYTPTAPTIKKQINPAFTVEAGEQENFVQCALHFRRLQTLHEGLRWFDIKRYGIEVNRRLVGANGEIKVAATLKVDDKRRALQIPKDVVNAGLEPNPR